MRRTNLMNTVIANTVGRRPRKWRRSVSPPGVERRSGPSGDTFRRQQDVDMLLFDDDDDDDSDDEEEDDEDADGDVHMAG